MTRHEEKQKNKGKQGRGRKGGGRRKKTRGGKGVWRMGKRERE